MYLEAVRSINEAEAKAAQLKKKASDHAALLLRDAKTAGKALLDSASERAVRVRSERLSDVETRCAEHVSSRREITENDKTALRNTAGSRVESAAVFIFEKVVNG